MGGSVRFGSEELGGSVNPQVDNMPPAEAAQDSH